MSGTIRVGNLQLPGVMHVMTDHAQQMADKEWYEVVRKLREQRSNFVSGPFTTEEMIWTGVNFIPKSEVIRMLYCMEAHYRHHKQVQKLAKRLTRPSHRYRVEHRARLVSQRRIAVVRRKTGYAES